MRMPTVLATVPPVLAVQLLCLQLMAMRLSTAPPLLCLWWMVLLLSTAVQLLWQMGLLLTTAL